LLPRRGDTAEKLGHRIARDREHLFVFVPDRSVPPANNVSERAAAKRDLPQSDEWVPLGLGRRYLPRLPLRRQQAKVTGVPHRAVWVRRWQSPYPVVASDKQGEQLRY